MQGLRLGREEPPKQTIKSDVQKKKDLSILKYVFQRDGGIRKTRNTWIPEGKRCLAHGGCSARTVERKALISLGESSGSTLF